MVGILQEEAREGREKGRQVNAVTKHAFNNPGRMVVVRSRSTRRRRRFRPRPLGWLITAAATCQALAQALDAFDSHRWVSTARWGAVAAIVFVAAFLTENVKVIQGG